MIEAPRASQEMYGESTKSSMSVYSPENATERLTIDGFLRVPLTKDIRNALQATFNDGYPFFRASIDEKKLNKLREDCGYRPIGVEYSQSPERPDPAESFTASMRVQAEANELPSATAKALYKSMLATIELLEPLAESLIIQLATSISGDSCGEKLRGKMRRWSCLQLNYSRPSNITTPFIHEPHEDGHLLTIVSATAPGLEVQIGSNNYLSIGPLLDEVFIMPGEITALLTGWQIKPLYHRVRPEPSCQERMAVLFFVDIDPELCEPWIRNEFNADVDIGAKILTNARRFGTQAFGLE